MRSLQVKRIQPFTMPLMSLAATAIDQPKDRESVVETMLQYLHTDPVCCRHEPGKLADLQHTVRTQGACSREEWAACLRALLQPSTFGRALYCLLVGSLATVDSKQAEHAYWPEKLVARVNRGLRVHGKGPHTAQQQQAAGE